jgi:hypothetical protein
MSGQRRLRILGQLVDAAGADVSSQRVCEVSADLTGVTGAGILLLSPDRPLASLGATDEVAATLGRLQQDLGEGPAVEAYEQQRSVQVPDLADGGPRRWVAFCGPAIEAGAGAVFAFPLQIGAVRLGAVHLYRRESGSMSTEQVADAMVLADIAAQSLLAEQSSASPGELAPHVREAGDFQLVVHQAAGMVSVQLGTSVAEALVRLRARAFAEGSPVRDIAREVVARRLRFTPEDDAR